MVVIIQGQKMACQPCIRGHRSTKCTHSDSRMLLAVNKPGRPLTSCPHLVPHSNCDCRRVVAAFPRKKTKCPCPTDQKGDLPPVAIPKPPSPTKHTFKVDKTVTGSNSRPRKPTLDSYADRIDTSHVNVIPTSQYRPQPIAPALSNGFQFQNNNHFVGFAQPDLTQDPSIIMRQGLNGQFPPSHTLFGPQSITQPLGGAFQPKQELVNDNGVMEEFFTGHGGGLVNDMMYRFTPTHAKMDSGISGLGVPLDISNLSTPRSMSSSKPTVGFMNPDTSQYPLQDTFQTSYSPIQSLQPQIPMYGLSSTYSTPETTISAPQWQPTNTFAQMLPPPFASNGSTYDSISGVGLPTQEELRSCNCGDGCNCLGCIVHLHNRRTTEYVQKAAREQWDDDKTKMTSPDYKSPPANSTSPSNGLEDDIEVNGVDYLFTEFTFPCAGDKSSCQCAEGCECDGCKTHDGKQCWGEEGSCPCGPECSCIGCTVHGNDIDKGVKKEEVSNGSNASLDSSEEDEGPKRSCCQ